MDKDALEILMRIEGKIDKIETRLGCLESRFDNLEIQVNENTQILKALKHSSEVNKAEHDKMNLEISKISGNVTKLTHNISVIEEITAKNWYDICGLKKAN